MLLMHLLWPWRSLCATHTKIRLLMFHVCFLSIKDEDNKEEVLKICVGSDAQLGCKIEPELAGR